MSEQLETPDSEAPLEQEEQPKRVAMRPEAYGFTQSAWAAVIGQAMKLAAQRDQARPKRRSLEEEWRALGVAHRPIDTSVAAAASYVKRATAMARMPIPELELLSIDGTNTYARALRAYREGLIEGAKAVSQC